MSVASPPLPRNSVYMFGREHDLPDMRPEELAVGAGFLRAGIAVSDLSADGSYYQLLQARGRDASNAAFLELSVLQEGLRNIVAISHPLLIRMARGHAVAAIVKEQTGEKGGRTRAPHRSDHSPLAQLRLNCLKQLIVHNGFMLALGRSDLND